MGFKAAGTETASVVNGIRKGKRNQIILKFLIKQTLVDLLKLKRIIMFNSN
jgi:hypothetical protein